MINMIDEYIKAHMLILARCNQLYYMLLVTYMLFSVFIINLKKKKKKIITNERFFFFASIIDTLNVLHSII